MLIVALAIGWLKVHEDDLVFAVARSKLSLVDELPARAARVAIAVGGDAAIAGVVFPAEKCCDTGYWVLLLHGNAASAFSADQVRHGEVLSTAGFSVLGIDYRGFGMSAGVPSEAAMYADAEAAFDALLQRGVAPERIILLGHSLGSGPAVVLATRHRAAALVLFGAFTSIPDAAAERYPWLPVRYVASVQFDSLARMRSVHIPVVVAHSRADTTIPYTHALKLYAAAQEPKRLLILDVPSNDGFGGHVDALFDNVPSLEAALSAVLPEPLRESGG
ncbi:MAG: alpha/beta fold hydrolase [Steroidobacteraceae bacterium]|jgi:pimeloyl-ACP methyl ester carboxylesterase